MLVDAYDEHTYFGGHSELTSFLPICEFTIFNSFNVIVLLFQLTSTSAIAAYINGSTVSVIMLLVGGSMVTEVNNVKVVEGSWCRLNLDLSPDSHQLNGKMTT